MKPSQDPILLRCHCASNASQSKAEEASDAATDGLRREAEGCPWSINEIIV